MLSLIKKFHHLKIEAQKSVVNIRPFILARGEINGKSPHPALGMIDRGYLPNSLEWARHHGTNPPVIVDKPVDGRFIFNSDEIANAPPTVS